MNGPVKPVLIIVLLLQGCTSKEREPAAPRQQPPRATQLQPGQENLDWIGEYTYSESVPPAPAPQSEQYKVDVCDLSGTAYIAVDGHLTSIRLKAKAREKPSKLSIYFESYGNDDLFRSGYNPGDLLVSVINKDGKYSMEWGSLTSQLSLPEKIVPLERTAVTCSSDSPPPSWQ